MRLGHRIVALAAALSFATGAIAISDPAFAKSYGGGGGYRSGSFSSSRGGGFGNSGGFHFGGSSPASSASARPTVYSNSAPSASKPTVYQAQAKGPTVMGGTTTNAAPRAALPQSSHDRLVSQHTSTAAYNSSAAAQGQRARVLAATNGRGYSPRQISYDRHVYITHYYPYGVPSYYGYFQDRSYGSWSGAFMAMMLTDAVFAHNYWYDPSYQMWYAQAQQQAAYDPTLRMQLASLQAQVNRMQGQPVNPNYVPGNVPPDVMYANNTLGGASATVPVMPVHHGHPWLWFLVILALIGGTVVFFAARRRQQFG